MSFLQAVGIDVVLTSASRPEVTVLPVDEGRGMGGRREDGVEDGIPGDQ